MKPASPTSRSCAQTKRAIRLYVREERKFGPAIGSDWTFGGMTSLQHDSIADGGRAGR
jgi:hypothetical protein